MPPHFLTNFGIYKYYQNEPKFNGVSWRNNLFEIKGGTYIINLNEFESIETQIALIALYVIAENTTYFHSFGVQHIPKKIENILEIKVLEPILIEYKHTIQ